MAATVHRRLLLGIAIAAYAVVFACFVLFEAPGLGLGHFFYIPVALLALAGGTAAGFAGGVVATGLYVVAIVITPRLPTREVLTLATVIRLVTYSSCGMLVGWFAGEHRRHVDQLRDLAGRDFLTGVLDTRAFDDALARRCAEGKPFLLLLGDMDDLKAVNDAHGHAAGNQELRRLAEALQRAFKGADELARVGGDEFGILTKGEIGDAARVCARLRERLAAEDLEITFGWAAQPDDGLAPLELFRKADDRLYAAKLIARNVRVVRQAVASRA